MSSTEYSTLVTGALEACASTLFASTISAFRSRVTPDVVESFQSVSTLADLSNAIRDIEREQANRKCLRNLGRIRPLLNMLQSYSKVIEIFVNAKPDVLAFIWGPIKLCL